MDDAEKQVLLDQFRTLLDGVDLNAKSSQLLTKAHSELDVFNVLSALAAIKHELQLQGQQFKATLNLLADEHLVIQSQLDQNHKQANHSVVHQYPDVLQQLLLMRDSIEAGLHISSQYRRKAFSLIPRSREKRMIQALNDGQTITLNRLDQILSDLHIKPVKTLGRRFDSRTMNAVATSHDDDYDDGVVSKQVRPGYCWNKQVLRVAVVIVNRIEAHV
jgi:molecular chaperone GrpE